MVELADMQLFVQAIEAGSLSAAGRQLGLSAAVASKRLTRLESHLGIRLVQRTSRQLRLTEAGEIYYARCRDVLMAAEDAEHAVTQDCTSVSGSLRISAPVALGRKWVGPALARFAEQHPRLHIHLALNDTISDLIAEGLDCAVRVGGMRDSRLISRKLANNFRVICASPEYLQKFGAPQSLEDLAHHQAIALDSPLPSGHVHWLLTPAAMPQPLTDIEVAAHRRQVSVPIRLSTNNGEQAHSWSLAGLGLVRRSIWDVAHELVSGRLVRILPHWISEPAPLHIVFPSRQFLPAKTRLFIDFLLPYFAEQNTFIESAAAGSQNDH